MTRFLLILSLGVLALAEQALDLGALKGLEDKAKEATSIDLGPDQLKLMMGFANDGGSKDLQNLARTIELVQVRTYEFDKENMYSLADMEALRAKVKNSDFVPFLSVKEKKGFTEILMRKGPKGLRGFVLLSAEPREITVINIVGDLDLNSLSKLSGKFGIPEINLGTGSKGGNKEDEN
ncbi:DUF4252 domain-containing protein [Bryobacter aggregatus]|uniref:DUF4252 domain-containing protein n=1 Tax=Bryobacter aggregatus TaxID=360054 RepID=UPI0004E2674F|nr:DUF4252 domain-containing protein [Bryobacter aggregatus]